MIDHARPFLGAIVRAVHARHVHPGGHHVPDQSGVVGGLRRQRDHDPSLAILGTLAEQLHRIPLQDVLAATVVLSGFDAHIEHVQIGFGPFRNGSQAQQHRFEVVLHAGFHATQ